MKDKRITARVSETERRRIASLSKKCGLSISEYVKQRALGYEPRQVLPDAFFVLCEKLDSLTEQPFSNEVNSQALSLLKEIHETLLSPAKEDMSIWQPPDSGQ